MRYIRYVTDAISLGDAGHLFETHPKRPAGAYDKAFFQLERYSVFTSAENVFSTTQS